MPKPKGAPKSGGRKPGTPNKRTAETQKMIEESGLTPLEFMLSIMRNDENEPAQRLAAANMAAPYVHARLSSVDATVSGPNGSAIDMNMTLNFVNPANAG